MWDLTSHQDRPHGPAVEAQSLNHWTLSEVLFSLFVCCPSLSPVMVFPFISFPLKAEMFQGFQAFGPASFPSSSTPGWPPLGLKDLKISCASNSLVQTSIANSSRYQTHCLISLTFPKRLFFPQTPLYSHASPNQFMTIPFLTIFRTKKCCARLSFFSPYYQTDKNTGWYYSLCRIRGLLHLHWGSFLAQPGFSPQQANKAPLLLPWLYTLYTTGLSYFCAQIHQLPHTVAGKVTAVQPPDSPRDLPPSQGSHPRSGFPDCGPSTTMASSRFSKQMSFSHLPSHPVISYPLCQECYRPVCPDEMLSFKLVSPDLPY